MKNAARHGDGVAAAPTILIAILFGCLATFVHYVTGDGERGAELPFRRPFCYKACGNGPCEFCCASEYTPTICWGSEAMCKHECHPPFRSPPVRMRRM